MDWNLIHCVYLQILCLNLWLEPTDLRVTEQSFGHLESTCNTVLSQLRSSVNFLYAEMKNIEEMLEI